MMMVMMMMMMMMMMIVLIMPDNADGDDDDDDEDDDDDADDDDDDGDDDGGDDDDEQVGHDSKSWNTPTHSSAARSKAHFVHERLTQRVKNPIQHVYYNHLYSAPAIYTKAL